MYDRSCDLIPIYCFTLVQSRESPQVHPIFANIHWQLCWLVVLAILYTSGCYCEYQCEPQFLMLAKVKWCPGMPGSSYTIGVCVCLRVCEMCVFVEEMMGGEVPLLLSLITVRERVTMVVYGSAEQYTAISIIPQFKISKPSQMWKPPILLCCIKVPVSAKQPSFACCWSFKTCVDKCKLHLVITLKHIFIMVWTCFVHLYHFLLCIDTMFFSVLPITVKPPHIKSISCCQLQSDTAQHYFMYACVHEYYIHRTYGTLGLKHEPLTLITPQFETPLPPLQPAVSTNPCVHVPCFLMTNVSVLSLFLYCYLLYPLDHVFFHIGISATILWASCSFTRPVWPGWTLFIWESPNCSAYK